MPMQPRPRAETSRLLPSVRFGIFSSDMHPNLPPTGDPTLTFSLRNHFPASIATATLPSSNTGGPAPGATTLARVGGDNQIAPAGSSLATPLSVLVTNLAGSGVPNVVVSWAVASGGGTVSAPPPEATAQD